MQATVQPKKDVAEKARKTRTGITLWTDGSKLDTGDARAAVVWFDAERLIK